MIEAKDIILPIIRLNGTSEQALVDQLADACSALRDVKDKLSEACPNGRDYYPVGPELFKDAQEQHKRRMKTVQDLIDELELEATLILDREV